MNRPVDPSLLATAKIHASVVAEATALGIAVGDNLAATLDLVLAEYRRIRTAHDNLAATVELCCLPVDGEVSLCDRVRAAGEAQRKLVEVRALHASWEANGEVLK